MHRALSAMVLVLLAGCAGRSDSVLGGSKAMVTVCAKTGDVQGALEMAQKHCEQYDRSAELIGSANGVLGTNEACKSEDGDYTGKIVHFRCTKD